MITQWTCPRCGTEMTHMKTVGLQDDDTFHRIAIAEWVHEALTIPASPYPGEGYLS